MRPLAPLIALLLVAGCGGPGAATNTANSGGFDSGRAFRDLQAQVAIGPRPTGSAGNRREVAFIVRRLHQAGLREVRVQRPYRNVVARIPGTTPGTVVVGAHHDTKDTSGFVGANDGASGVALVLELARGLPPRLDGPSIELVLFDAEEARGDRPFAVDGARGSAQFVRYARRGGVQGSPPLTAIRGMVLFDMVADCNLQIPREAFSDPGLYDDFAVAASDFGNPRRGGRRGLPTFETSGGESPFAGEAAGVFDDHVPFIRAGIPAVDLIDFTYGPGPSPGAFWHTRADSLEHVCRGSLETVGTAALTALPSIR